MKLIDIGYCIDNKDPKGLGRIRCLRPNEPTSVKEKSIKYDKWSDLDPFVALPFLPININHVPEVGQSIKLLSYNTEKENVNQEYIAGPFSSMYDLNGQSFSQQIENTSYGIINKKSPDIFNENGEYINKKSVGSFAKDNDFAIYGKYGSDVVFTENGIQLRAGKFLPKENTPSATLNTMSKYPIMSDNVGRISLKKYSNKVISEKERVIRTETEIGNLNFIIEYDIDSLTTPTEVNIFVYSIINNLGRTYKTDFFNENSPLQMGSLKLINTDGTDTTPTIIESIDSINDTHRIIKDIIYRIKTEGLFSFNPFYPRKDIHPFFFRPKESFKIKTPLNQNEEILKQRILNGVKVFNVGPGHGLIWSPLSAKPNIKEISELRNVLKIDRSSNEQTLGSIIGDKMYFLSTDTNFTEKTIDFKKLDKYELTQEDYLSTIEPNTYSLVRGEILLQILKQMYSVLTTHAHNINEPYARSDYREHTVLVELFKKLENELLNKSLRIN